MIPNMQPPGTSNQLSDILQLTQGSKVSNGFRQVLGSIVGTAGNILLPGIGGAIGAAIGGSALGSALPALGSETTQYLALQQEVQNESMVLETISTVMKDKHDLEMDIIRNSK